MSVKSDIADAVESLLLSDCIDLLQHMLDASCEKDANRKESYQRVLDSHDDQSIRSTLADTLYYECWTQVMKKHYWTKMTPDLDAKESADVLIKFGLELPVIWEREKKEYLSFAKK